MFGGGGFENAMKRKNKVAVVRKAKAKSRKISKAKKGVKRKKNPVGRPAKPYSWSKRKNQVIPNIVGASAKQSVGGNVYVISAKRGPYGKRKMKPYDQGARNLTKGTFTPSMPIGGWTGLHNTALKQQEDEIQRRARVNFNPLNRGGNEASVINPNIPIAQVIYPDPPPAYPQFAEPIYQQAPPEGQGNFSSDYESDPSDLPQYSSQSESELSTRDTEFTSSSDASSDWLENLRAEEKRQQRLSIDAVEEQARLKNDRLRRMEEQVEENRKEIQNGRSQFPAQQGVNPLDQRTGRLKALGGFMKRLTNSREKKVRQRQLEQQRNQEVQRQAEGPIISGGEFEPLLEVRGYESEAEEDLPQARFTSFKVESPILRGVKSPEFFSEARGNQRKRDQRLEAIEKRRPKTATEKIRGLARIQSAGSINTSSESEGTKRDKLRRRQAFLADSQAGVMSVREPEAPKGSHFMPDGSLMKDSEMKKKSNVELMGEALGQLGHTRAEAIKFLKRGKKETRVYLQLRSKGQTESKAFKMAFPNRFQKPSGAYSKARLLNKNLGQGKTKFGVISSESDYVVEKIGTRAGVYNKTRKATDQSRIEESEARKINEKKGRRRKKKK